MISTNTKDTDSVVDFYAGKSVFVTGGTGFLGKLVIEKLLWSCPGIENIYMLIRSKGNNDETSRLTTILSTPVFDRLRKTRPNDLEKIIPISGDLSKPHIGISPSDTEILINKVSVIFHVAATVRFNEPMKQALAVNAIGTHRLYEFCHQMHNIKAFIYVSTAYCNCKEEVKEEIYSLPYDPDKIISMMELLNDDLAETVTPKLIGEYPNTYTFTKAVAENMLRKYHTQVPITIIRPSCVLSSLEEPVVGWIDNKYGLTALVAAITNGIIHGMIGDERIVVDIVPADIVVNLTICAAWRTVVSSIMNINIYHCCSGQVNPITWGEFMKYCTLSAIKNPAEELLLYPHFSFHTNKILDFLQMFFLEKVPAYLVDGFHYCTGRKTMFVHFHRRLLRVKEVGVYFTTRQYNFLVNNTHNLSNLLSESDGQIFPIDVRSIHWPTYVSNYCLGIRHYILKQSPDTLLKSRKRLKRLKWTNACIPCLLLFSILYLIFIF